MADRDKLWEDYNRSNGNGGYFKKKLVEHYFPWMENIVGGIYSKSYPFLEKGDLIGEGSIGLIRAVEMYDENRGEKFKTYAEYKVRGAILDSLRRDDFVSKPVRTSINQVEHARSVLYDKLGYDPDREQVLGELAGDEYKRPGKVRGAEKAEKIYNDAHIFSGHCDLGESVYFLDRQCFLNGLGLGDVGSDVLFDSEKRRIRSFVDNMSLRDVKVLRLYYNEGLNGNEIGGIVGLTGSRVSQLHSKIVKRFKEEVKDKALSIEEGMDFASRVLDYIVAGSSFRDK